MPTTQPVPSLSTETLIALCNESLSQAKEALQRSTAAQFPHLAAYIRTSAKQQLHTLLLLDRRATRADVHCAFHALAHIRKPWIIDTRWQATLNARSPDPARSTGRQISPTSLSRHLTRTCPTRLTPVP